MSADNYMLIRKHRGEFVVSMEFASDDKPRRVDRKGNRRFAAHDKAVDYARGEWTEYGVRDRTLGLVAPEGGR